MLSLNNVSMRSARGSVRGRDHHVLSGRRYAITGPNGAGKSTFMKILTGRSSRPRARSAGRKKMGVLRQDQFAFDEFRVIDTVMMGNPRFGSATGAGSLYAKDRD